MHLGTKPAEHRQPNHRSCAATYTRQQTRLANPNPTGTGKTPGQARARTARREKGDYEGQTKHRKGTSSSNEFHRVVEQERAATRDRPLQRTPRPAKAMPRANAKPAHRPSSPKRAKEQASGPSAPAAWQTRRPDQRQRSPQPGPRPLAGGRAGQRDDRRAGQHQRYDRRRGQASASRLSAHRPAPAFWPVRRPGQRQGACRRRAPHPRASRHGGQASTSGRAGLRAKAPLEEPAKISHKSSTIGGQSHHRRGDRARTAGRK